MRRAGINILVVALLLAAAAVAPQASRAAAPIDEAWRWTTFTTQSGLPADRIHWVVQTPTEAWAITPAGIARFDGWGWSPVEFPGLDPEQRFRILTPDGHGGVFVGVETMLFQAGAAGIKRVPLPPEISGWFLESAVAFRGGVLVHAKRDIFSPRGPLRFLDLGAGTTAAGASADIPADVSHLSEGGGTVFVAADGALLASDGGPWERLFDAPGVRPRPQVISGTRAGGYLISMHGPSGVSGLYRWAPGTAPEPLEGEGEEIVVALAVSGDGDAIIAYSSGHLRWRHEGAWRTLEGSWPMLREAIWLGYGPDGSLWTCTADGVHRARAARPRWTVLAEPRPSRCNVVNSIVRGRDGSLWLATGQGIIRHRPDGSRERVDEVDGLRITEVTSVAEDRLGRVWAASGSALDGAIVFDGASWSRVVGRDPGQRLFIHRVVTDPEGRPYFLGLAPPDAEVREGVGVLREEGGQLVPWEPARGIPSKRVYDVEFGPRGEVWFGTWAGLSRLRDGQWTTWTDKQGLNTSRAFDIALDDAGRPWFTGQAHGIGRIDADGGIHYLRAADGLPSDEVWGLAFDRRDRLWATTVAGIACIDGGTPWTIGLESGLPLARTWPLLVEPDQVIIGTLGAGVATLSLEEMTQPAPRIDIDVVGIGDESVRVSWRALAWQGVTAPQSVETRHRVDAGPWSPWGRARSVVIPLRSEGRVLEVEAKSPFPGGAAGRASRRVDLTTPWHRRPWFALVEAAAALAAIAAAAVLFVRRRRQATDLRHSEARYRLLSSVVTEGVAVVEGRGRILDANPALGELLGRDPAGLVGADLAAILNMSVPDAGAAPVEVSVRRPDGEERVAEIVARDHRWRGHGATVVVLRDVTERKSAEAERLEMQLRLRRAHELESLGLLAGRIAHDFNNVLAAVIGNQELAAERVNDPVVRSHLDQARAAARQAADLSQQMLAASGRGRLAVRDVDLSAHVDQMVDFLRASLSKNTRITRELAPDLPAIEADPTQLSQLILNLVTNASDAIGSRGGTITLRTARTEDGSGVVLDVRDDGAGIDAETRARLFEPFFTTRPEGRGLGLVTVSSVAKSHGATIDVESEPGRGATFRVRFPATARRVSLPSPAKAAAVASSAAPPGLVLVADDEPMVRTLTAGFLRRIGATILEAADGAEALRLVDAHGSELDAAVLDLTMPRASGLEVLDAIRRVRPTLPVVLVTGYSQEDVASRVAGDPHAAVLAKPFTASELSQILATLRVENTGQR